MITRVNGLLIGGGIAVALLAVLGMAAFSTRAQIVLGGLVADRGAVVTRDVPYGPHDRHRLDIYRPVSDDVSSPVVFFVYGGSWRYGHRAVYAFVGAALAARGVTAVIADYRLYPEVRFPAFVEDTALAYRWIAENIAGEGPRRRPLVLAGHSAGAHMAALLAYDARYLAKAAPGAPRPDAFIGLAGPYAFDPTTWPSTADIFSTAKSADEARPVSFVGPNAPPSLLFHGLADDVVKPWNTRTLADALAAHDIPARKIELDHIGHLGVALAIARPLRWRAPVLDEIVAFIKTVTPRDAGASLAKGSP